MMMMTPLRRLAATRSAFMANGARRLLENTRVGAVASSQSRLFGRNFSTEPSQIRRPKAIRVKKSDARRRVEPKPKAEEQPHNALVEQQEYTQAPAPYDSNPFQQPQGPTSFGGMLKESFLWGIGMALAFTVIGAVFMEEAEEPGLYEASTVIKDDQTVDDNGDM